MNPKLKAFLEQEKSVKNEQQSEARRDLLLSLGLVDDSKTIIEWLENPKSADEIELYPLYDEQKGMYYRKTEFPIDITDEEYAELLKYVAEPVVENSRNKTVLAESLVAGIATFSFIICAIMAVWMMFDYSIVYGVILFVCAIFQLACVELFVNISKTLGKIERNQHDIVDKLSR